MKTLIVSAMHLELKQLLDKAEKIDRIDDKLSSYNLDVKEFDLLCAFTVKKLKKMMKQLKDEFKNLASSVFDLVFCSLP